MTDAAATAAPAKGLLARIVGMFVSPRATYEAVVAHPRPVGVLFVSAVVIGLATGLPQFTERGQQAALDAQVQAIEQLTRQPVSDEMYQQMRGRAQFGAISQIVGALVSLPVMCLFFAVVYWVIFNAILGGTATFKQVLTVVTHSQVIGALGAAVSAPVMYMQGSLSMAGPFNLGMLVPMLDETNLIAKILGATSVFMLWSLVVLAIGFSVLYRRKTQNIAMALLLAYFLIVAAVFAVIGSFTGS